MFWRRSDSSASSNGSGGLAVGEEIAELALVVGADRLVQRDRRGRGRERLVDVLDRQAGRLGELVLRRLAAELDLEPARGARQLLLPLDDVDGNADRARVVRDRALHRLADPPRRVRRELVAAAPVELLDGAVEAERSLLDQVEERHAETAVALRDRDDETQVGLDHAPLRDQVAALDRLRERDLLGGGEQLVTADVGKEELQAVAGAGRLVGLPHDVLLRCLRGGLLVGDGLAHLEPDALELARQLLDVELGKIVLERERLELGRLDPAALLAHVEHRAGAFGFEQFGQLILRQVPRAHPFATHRFRNLRTVWDFSSVCQGESGISVLPVAASQPSSHYARGVSLSMDDSCRTMRIEPLPSFENALRSPLFAAFFRRARFPSRRQQLGRAFLRQRLHCIARAQTRVHLAVGDVRPETAVLDHHRLPAHRIGAELAQRRRGRGAPAPLLRLGEQRERLLERHREQLLLVLERARLGALLDVRAVAAVRGDDLLAVGRVGAERARQREQRQRVLQVTVSGDIDLKSEPVRGFSPFSTTSVTYGPVAAGLDDDRVARLRVDAELALLRGPATSSSSAFATVSSSGAMSSEIVARWPLALDVRPVAADAQLDAVADRDRVDRARVDVAEIRDERLQPARIAVRRSRSGAARRSAPPRRTRSGRGRPPAAP